MKVSSLEVELRVAKKKIQLLEKSLAWSTDREEYGWDWSKRFFELQNQLKAAEDSYNTYRLGWCNQVADLKWKLRAIDER